MRLAWYKLMCEIVALRSLTKVAFRCSPKSIVEAPVVQLSVMFDCNLFSVSQYKTVGVTGLTRVTLLRLIAGMLRSASVTVTFTAV